MKTLLILRHAKSSWKDDTLSDHDRPLNKRGMKDAPRMGELMKELDILPDLILSSTAKRARATAEIVADESGFEGEIQLSRDLYSFSPEAYLEALTDVPDEFQRLMIVGHNPGLEEILEALTGSYERLPTAALVQISLPIEHWVELNEEIEGELINVWLPKEL